jgi:hypothetical protein
MKTIAETFNVDTFNLAATEANVNEEPPITKKQTPTEIRVPLNELELVYMRDPTVFNGINKITQTIMSARHEIKAKDQKVLKYFVNFTENLGNSGSDITWDELLEKIFQYECIYGRSFVENIFNKKGNRIVDWDIVDSKTIDYAKDSKNKIVLDRFNRPVGYTQTLSFDNYNFNMIKEKPSDPRVSLLPNQLFVSVEKLAQIKLFTVGDGFYGIGLIEPIYVNSIRKQNMEEALANNVWRHGFPIVWAKLGDMSHEPTPEQVQTMLDKLKDLTFKKEIATPYYYDLQMLESKQSTKLQEHLAYYQDQQVTGMGIPKPYAIGSGEATNRATLSNMSDLYQLTLREIITNTTSAIRKYMFKPICDLEGFKEIPWIDWDMVGIDEIDRKSKRLLSYIKSGLLPPNLSIQEYIKKIEDLD